MAWENIETRLVEPLKTKMTFTGGAVWVAENPMSIDEWLSSVAETDEELRELELPRFRFLENRWPIVRLVEFDSDWRDRLVLLAMHVGRRAYMLLKHEDYRLIGAIEPATNAGLYGIVIGALLHSGELGWSQRRTYRNWHPELIPNDLIERPVDFDESDRTQERKYGLPQSRDATVSSHNYGSKLLFVWIGPWFAVPVVGYWHDDLSDPPANFAKGESVMRYKPTYGDKQRDAQKRRKHEQLERIKRETPTPQQPQRDADQDKSRDRDNGVA
jgi:hypothetical protein